MRLWIVSTSGMENHLVGMKFGNNPINLTDWRHGDWAVTVSVCFLAKIVARPLYGAVLKALCVF
jgi:hypothetical protein